MNGSGKFPNDFIGGVYDAAGMGVKVAVVGGGSTYTPELVEGFVTRGDRLPVDELVLLDIDEDAAAVVGALAERMMRRRDGAARWCSPDERAEALEGADFVIVQLRVGGNRPRGTRTRRSRSSSGASGRRPPGPAGSRRRCAPCPSCWIWRSYAARGGARAPGSWTSRTRPGS